MGPWAHFYQKNLHFFKGLSNTNSKSKPVDVFYTKEADVNGKGSLDNLIKGGAGQAVQNLNFIYNFKFNEGLKWEIFYS